VFKNVRNCGGIQCVHSMSTVASEGEGGLRATLHITLRCASMLHYMLLRIRIKDTHIDNEHIFIRYLLLLPPKAQKYIPIC